MPQTHTQSDLAFRLMAYEFYFRDLLHPPKKILSGVGVKPGMTVLDFGCGPGGHSIASAELIGQKGHVYAVDIKSLALKMVMKAAIKRGLQNIETLDGSGIGAVPADSVDLVLLYDVLHDIDEPALVLREFYRMLKADGRISVSDHHLEENAIISALTADGYFQRSDRTEKTIQFNKVITTSQ